MITLKNVNKYFNRFKKNQIHVINNTSLDFKDTGLVALLGPSGCGKTTLLNAIGGLDKISSGKIYINGIKMPRRFNHKKDKIRTLNIGYIFQNYNLLDNMSVYDNIALSLKMIGIKNKKEIKRRVEYVLNKVDMYRFRNRPCSMLSGGQRQRVGIARALIKNPSVIIADEPTGNLDSKNTIEIMNIIKAISMEKLVILVTHEKELAHFYASRIIDITDGTIINDKENKHQNELDYRIDDNIYLKDFKNHDLIEDDDYKINIYSDLKKKIKLDIVLKNGNIYIKTNTDKIEVVDDDSNINFINDHYKKINKEDYQKTNFDLKELENKKIRYSSIYNIISSIVVGIKRVLDYSLIKKILLLGFVASSMFILYAISNIYGVTNIKDSDFVEVNKKYLYVSTNKGNYELYDKLKDKVDYIIPGDSNIEFTLKKDDLYQFSREKLFFVASISDISLIDNLLYGTMPQNNNEVVIDKMVYDNQKKIGGELNFSTFNILNYQDLIGQTITKENLEYKIVGVTDLSSPSIYINKNEFANIINIKEDSKYIDYNLAQNIEIKKGRKPENDYEILININEKEEHPLNKEIKTKINDHKLKVVGYYSTLYDNNTYYVAHSMIEKINIKENKGFTIYSKDKGSKLEELMNDNIKVRDTYKYGEDKYKKSIKDSIKNTFIISSILMAISFIEIYLMIRASFMSRIKEIGIMRAIGVKKFDIYKIFAGEILVITTITGIPGVLLMTSILKEITKVSLLSGMFMLNIKIVLISIILIYAFNLIVGLIPIWNVIRKTPAYILSRNDVD